MGWIGYSCWRGFWSIIWNRLQKVAQTWFKTPSVWVWKNLRLLLFDSSLRLKAVKKRARSEFWSRTIGSILDTENEMKELDEAFIGMDCNAATAIRSTAWPEVARSSILRATSTRLMNDLVPKRYMLQMKNWTGSFRCYSNSWCKIAKGNTKRRVGEMYRGWGHLRLNRWGDGRYLQAELRLGSWR